MKKIFLSLTLVVLGFGITVAQEKGKAKKAISTQNAKTTEEGKKMIAGDNKPAETTASAAPATTLVPDNMNFSKDVHDFGTIQEGPSADYTFDFTNTGKEPIIVQKVQASCGCTTPSYSKDPVLPGKQGEIKASYNTNGRVGPFTKTITVTSNAGIKVVTIKGTVEKAPTSSVPENNSMIKTN
jgi:Protein of unknown function (DUF1573)